jgi:hypothetical protein
MTPGKKLKPCPFCGGAALLVVDHDHAWVTCPTCGADSRSFIHGECYERSWRQARVAAHLAWQRRAKP